MVIKGTVHGGAVSGDRGLWRLLLAAIFVVTLVGSFTLGRVSRPAGFTVAPAQPWADVAHPGSGHVPRVWVHVPAGSGCRGCRALGR